MELPLRNLEEWGVCETRGYVTVTGFVHPRRVVNPRRPAPAQERGTSFSILADNCPDSEASWPAGDAACHNPSRLALRSSLCRVHLSVRPLRSCHSSTGQPEHHTTLFLGQDEGNGDESSSRRGKNVKQADRSKRRGRIKVLWRRQGEAAVEKGGRGRVCESQRTAGSTEPGR
ncbi:uncharacterized [Tachysurus ichikawai]